MYQKIAVLLLAVAACAVLAGCKKDSEINSVMADIHSFTNDIAGKIEAQPTTEGVTAAQKVMDARKDEMKAKWDSIKEVRGFQVSDEVKNKMVDSYKQDYMQMKSLEIKYMSQSLQDPEFRSKLEKLVSDWEETFKFK